MNAMPPVVITNPPIPAEMMAVMNPDPAGDAATRVKHGAANVAALRACGLLSAAPDADDVNQPAIQGGTGQRLIVDRAQIAAAEMPSPANDTGKAVVSEAEGAQHDR